MAVQALEDMKSIPNWVVWCLQPKKGKPNQSTKVPYNPKTGFGAMTNNKSTWTTYTNAAKALKTQTNRYGKPYDGVGFVLSKDTGITFIDLDHCRNPENGEIMDWAWSVIEKFDSYSEQSPSGTGIHIFVRGRLTSSGHKRTLDKEGYGGYPCAIEMYDDLRFATMTGKQIPGTNSQLSQRQYALSMVQKTYIHIEDVTPHPVIIKPTVTRIPQENDIIQLIERSKQGNKFRRLFYDGDMSEYNNDHNIADIALVQILLFWTQGDVHRTDELFRQSKLMRYDNGERDCKHWDSPRMDGTYGSRTIEYALSRTTKFYDPSYGTKK